MNNSRFLPLIIFSALVLVIGISTGCKKKAAAKEEEVLVEILQNPDNNHSKVRFLAENIDTKEWFYLDMHNCILTEDEEESNNEIASKTPLFRKGDILRALILPQLNYDDEPEAAPVVLREGNRRGYRNVPIFTVIEAVTVNPNEVKSKGGFK